MITGITRRAVRLERFHQPRHQVRTYGHAYIGGATDGRHLGGYALDPTVEGCHLQYMATAIA
ncbi:hypothetical protein D3C85_1547300 [compost metagenome]